MSELIFWKDWNKSDRFLYIGMLVMFMISIFIFTLSYYYGADAIINWVIVSQNKLTTLLQEGADLGVLTLKYNLDNLLIIESFEGSDLKINYQAANIFMIFVGLCLVYYLTLITTLSRFWFIAGAIIFMLLMINFKFDQLLIFDQFENIGLYASLGIFLPVLYYFQAFAKNTGFWLRFLVFFILVFAFSTFLLLFAEVSNPVLYLSNYGIAFPVVISILFIFSVAVEPIVAFLYITTNNNNSQSKRSATHFTLLTFVYLINVAFVYAKNRQFIDWDFYYIDEFYLLIFSSIIGIWGFKHRRELYDNVLPFRTVGATFYFLLAVFSFITISYLFATGNDPLIETIEDAIIFSHLSFGLFFFIYVISNFIGPLMANLQVFKVVYKPTQMPYYVMRFMGLVGVGALFFQSGQLAKHQAVAGYYNGIGDLYMAVDDDYVAEQYYKLASQFEFQNHRSNYGLASLANKNDKTADAMYYYQQSILKQPTAYAFANLANIYAANDLFFDAVFSLQKGLEIFPDNPYLLNNLGLLYGKINVLDSAALFLSQSIEIKETQDVAASNLMAIVAEIQGNMAIDSIADQYGNSTYLPLLNNLLVLSNKNIEDATKYANRNMVTDSLLNPNTSAYLYNLGLNYSQQPDSVYNQFLEMYIEVDGNTPYAERLSLSKAINSYGNDEVIDAFKTIDILQIQSTVSSGYYNNINGLWALDQHDPKLAIQFFDVAISREYTDAWFNKAFALIMLDSLSTAQSILSQIEGTDNNGSAQAIHMMNELLDADNVVIEELDDQRKSLLLFIYHYRFSDEERNTILNTMSSSYFQLLSQMIYMERLYRDQHYEKAELIFNELSTLQIDENELAYRMLKFQIRTLIKNERWDEAYTKTDLIKEDDLLLTNFLVGRESLQSGNMELAKKAFDYIANKNPFEEKYIIEAANFYQAKVRDENLAYETILTALLINPNSILLSKAYINQCLEMGLTNYAEEELEHLKTIASQQDYLEFMNSYIKSLAEKELSAEW